MSKKDYYQTWRIEAEFNRVQDFLTPKNEVWSDSEIQNYFESNFDSDRYGNLKVKGQVPIAPHALIKQWNLLVKDCPDYVLNAARGISECKEVNEPLISETARKIMRNQGYRAGRGLGPKSKGVTSLDCWEAEPRQKPRAGLGFNNKRAKSSSSKPPKVVCIADPEGAGIRYAHIKTYPNRPPQLRLLDLTPKGKPVKTNTYIDIDAGGEVYTAVVWRGAVLGPAEFTYPHPSGWVVNTLDKPYDLTQLTVKRMTAIFRREHESPPSCLKAWPKYLNEQRLIPLELLGSLIHSPLTTTKDIHSWFKCILHRGMCVRHVSPCNGNTHCRVCGRAEECIEHFAICTGLDSTFKPFIVLARALNIRTMPDATLKLLGCVPCNGESYTPLPNGLLSLLLVLWKFIILMLTEVDTQGAKFCSEKVWRLTALRISERLNALRHAHQLKITQTRQRDLPPPNPAKLNRRLAPLCQVDEEGNFTYTEPFVSLLKSHAKDQFRLDSDAQESGALDVRHHLSNPITFVSAGLHTV